MTVAQWSPQELKSCISGDDIVLLDLKADWCPQCGPQLQVLERIAPDFKDQVSFGSVDIGKHPEVGEAYNVRSLPTLLIFKDGALAEQLSGYKKGIMISQALNRVIGS